ncbi:MAG TPA: AIPR family protein [Chthoniobacterales bacterium]
MKYETPIEIIHLPAGLRQEFSGRIPEATSGSTADRESNFLSRALAAYAIHKLAACSLDEAAESIVDGGGDGGIDAVYYSPAAHVLWIVQSKFISAGRGEPDLGGMTKFKTGIENLLQGNFEAFEENQAWKKRIPQIKTIFSDGSLRVRAVVVYSGVNLVSEDRRRLFEDLRRRFSPDDDYLQVQLCNLTTIHDWLTGADQGPGVLELEITLLKPGWVKDPYETVYGLLPLSDLAEFYAAHGRRLIAANIRAYKGETEVNEQILATIREEPNHFFYLNNGLTAYCELHGSLKIPLLRPLKDTFLPRLSRSSDAETTGPLQSGSLIARISRIRSVPETLWLLTNNRSGLPINSLFPASPITTRRTQIHQLPTPRILLLKKRRLLPHASPN